MTDPSYWPTAAIAVILAIAGAWIVLRLVLQRQRTVDEDRQIIRQLRDRIVEVRETEGANGTGGRTPASSDE